MPEPTPEPRDHDGAIIANQARKIRRLSEGLALVEQHRDEDWETMAELFNAPDSDTWHPMHSAMEAVAFIEAQPCTCPPDAGPPDYESDPCKRCHVLGRALNIPHGR
jgi:hypothetical protein